jgi:dihydrofolate synthase/folylpolyglutamate synthase
VIEAGCTAAGAPFVSVRERARITALGGARYGQSFTLETPAARYALDLPVLGAFQRRNAATAVTALEVAPPNLQLSVDEIERGLAQLVIPGRMEFFPGHPGVVFDIAHNADKAASLAGALLETFPGRRFTLVVAIGEGKDAVGVLAPLYGLPAAFVFTSFSAAGRAPQDPQRLARMATARGFSSRAIGDPVEALSIARRGADGSDVVVITGSTFVVATLRDWWLSNVGTKATRS